MISLCCNILLSVSKTRIKCHNKCSLNSSIGLAGFSIVLQRIVIENSGFKKAPCMATEI